MSFKRNLLFQYVYFTGHEKKQTNKTNSRVGRFLTVAVFTGGNIRFLPSCQKQVFDTVLSKMSKTG